MTGIGAAGIPWYRREDWDAIKRIFVDPDDLHDTFDEWRKAAGNLESNLRRDGRVVERAYIDPETFPDWCRSRGLNIDSRARSQFASEFVSEKHGKTG